MGIKADALVLAYLQSAKESDNAHFLDPVAAKAQRESALEKALDASGVTPDHRAALKTAYEAWLKSQTKQYIR